MKDRKSGAQDPMEAATSRNKKPTAKLGREIQAKLGQQLRAMYDDVVDQGVPDRFSDLLNQLESKKDKS